MSTQGWRLACAWVLALAAGGARAEGAAPGPRVVTLAQALHEAADHQPALLAARARLAASQATTRVPRALWLPRLGVTAQALEGTSNNSTASYVGVPAMDIPRIGGSATAATWSWQPYASTLVGVGLRQEVFDFGRIAALSALADAQLAAERSRTDLSRLDVAFAVEETFFAVQGSKAVLAAAGGALQRAVAHRDFARAGVQQGLRPPIELTRAEADLSRFAVGVERAKGGVVTAQVSLAAAVGSPDARLDAAVGELPYAPLPDARGLARAVLAHDPSVLEARARLGAQEAQTRVISSALLPELAFTAGVTGRAGGAPSSSGLVLTGQGWVPDVPNWDAALVLSWTLVDFGSFAQHTASRAEESARTAEVEEVEQRISALVEQAYVTAQTADETLPALEHAAQAARDNDAQADARFRAGLGTSVELADAEALRTDAEIQLALGHFEADRARARLGRAISEGL